MDGKGSGPFPSGLGREESNTTLIFYRCCAGGGGQAAEGRGRTNQGALLEESQVVGGAC